MSLEKNDPRISEQAVGDAEASSSHSQAQDAQATGNDSNDAVSKPGFFGKVSLMLDSWYYLWEVLGLVISAAAIVGICIVVWYFNGKPPPNWQTNIPGRDQQFRLTINSLLSIISVFGSTCAMIPVTKGLGQLKYLWFMEQDRKLADLEMFDSASRGKLGSAQLIWKLRFKHLAVLGGLASLLALAYGPFVQNLIEIELIYPVVDNIAQISYVERYLYEPEENVTAVDRTMKFAMDSSIADESNEWFTPPLKCPTGECAWKSMYTLAACTHCTDISDLLTRSCSPFSPASGNRNETGGCQVSLPNGMSFENVTYPDLPVNEGWSRARVVFAMNATVEPLVYTGQEYEKPLALVQSIMGFDPEQMPDFSYNLSRHLRPYMITEDSPIVARECIIVPCVQEQDFNLWKLQAPTASPSSGGGLVDSSDDKDPEVFIRDEVWNYTVSAHEEGDLESVHINFDALESNMTQQQLERWTGVPQIAGAAYKGLRDHLQTYLTSYMYTFDDPQDGDKYKFGPTDPNGFDVLTGSPSRSPFTDMLTNSHLGLWGSPHCLYENATANDVECAMYNLGAGITNGMRVADWEQLYGQSSRFNGTAYGPVQNCKAQWQYIAAPVAVWLLGLLLFVGVVWKTRRANIKAWRTSPLATLLLRLDPDSREHLKNWQHMGDAELRNTAEALRLQLRIDEEGPPRFIRKETAGQA